MDSFQNQISAITQKLDALNKLTEQLSDKINHLVAGAQPVSEQHHNVQLNSFTESLRSRSDQLSRFESTMGHKDILLDSDYPTSDGHTGERTLTPEVQIQRLTAQLTAAYGRIAALEEQLLARRIPQ